MTRINSAIPVKSLTDEHLLAEHREIKRLPFYLHKALKSGSINHLPTKFVLGKGHVLFFVNKMGFLFQRYKDIRQECLRRGFDVADYSVNFEGVKGFDKLHIPTAEEYDILVKRIAERINESTKKQWHYYKKPISKEEAISLLR